MEKTKASIEVKGDRGYLRTGYQVMAEIKSWSVVNRPDTLGTVGATSQVSARIISIDWFWSTYRPTSLWLWMGDVWWVWRKVISCGVIEEGKQLDLEVEGAPEIHT